MNTVEYQKQKYEIAQNESVLQCLLRHAVAYPHSCQIGVCQSCLMKSNGNDVNPAWQEGLPDTLKMQGYFLACLAQPQTALTVAAPNADECDAAAVITDIALLNKNVMQLKCQLENISAYIPGQYITLINPAGVARSYSIANIPEHDGYIELHVKINLNGKMGQWLWNEARINTNVTLRGPFGRCFYHNPDKTPYDILLAGTGTGLAPLIAIVKSALHHQHPGKITLVHGGVTDDDIYYFNELATLSAQHKNFTYDPCVLNTQGKFPIANIDQRALSHLKHPKTTKTFLCGSPDIVNKLKKQFFLAGVPSNAILYDLFL